MIWTHCFASLESSPRIETESSQEMSVSVDSLNLQGHYFVLRKACYNTNPKHLEDYAHPWIEGETEEQEHQSLLCLWDMVAGVGWDLKVFPKHVLKSEEGHTVWCDWTRSEEIMAQGAKSA